MEAYVDDFFGGPQRSEAGGRADKRKAELLFVQLITVGELTGAKMNRKKCFPPARKMEILGFLYDSIAKSCRLSQKKQEKYINRINVVLNSPAISEKNLEKLVGNLTYSA